MQNVNQQYQAGLFLFAYRHLKICYRRKAVQECCTASMQYNFIFAAQVVSHNTIKSQSLAASS